ncbi:hypothetical protein B0T14DRAFT_536521 [Immersiella caudata]|uniref:Alcohol dehydrogenase-like N-terminal domain-containing protein n=1 Tax=Immersiella caudata TaxID=314043 RepID=A0AA39WY10_9PEZI|nr:hypothetical protein B0T14DRAFT_536521 [Immersiella caudata]
MSPADLLKPNHGREQSKSCLDNSYPGIPGPDEVLIKVMAAGLNPKAWRFVLRRDDINIPLNAGDDLTGMVDSAGSNVDEYKPGDRVAAFHRMAFPTGAYAGFACLGLLVPTTPVREDIPVLIYGGATAVGVFALQLGKLSNLEPSIAVAGAGIDFVKSLNAADHIIDYRKGNVVQDILAALGGKSLHHALDAVSERQSHRHISGDNDGWTFPENVMLSRTLVARAYYLKHELITPERSLLDGDFAFFFYRYLPLLLARGSFKPHPHEVLPNGLDGIAEGVQRLYDGKVSAKKLVVRYGMT